jgi:hypothetical protein
MKDIRPSQRAYAAVRRLARKAARTDHWMRPEIDDILTDDLDADNPGEISERHRDSWRETCHWQILYGTPISAIVDQQEQRFGPLTFEDRYYGLYLELLDAFWDEWESQTEFWAAVENRPCAT